MLIIKQGEARRLWRLQLVYKLKTVVPPKGRVVWLGQSSLVKAELLQYSPRSQASPCPPRLSTAPVSLQTSPSGLADLWSPLHEAAAPALSIHPDPHSTNLATAAHRMLHRPSRALPVSRTPIRDPPSVCHPSTLDSGTRGDLSSQLALAQMGQYVTTGSWDVSWFWEDNTGGLTSLPLASYPQAARCRGGSFPLWG